MRTFIKLNPSNIVVLYSDRSFIKKTSFDLCTLYLSIDYYIHICDCPNKWYHGAFVWRIAS